MQSLAASPLRRAQFLIAAALAGLTVLATTTPSDAAQGRSAVVTAAPVNVSVSAPSRVVSNGTATIKVTTEAGHTGTATLYTRSAAGEWQAWGSPIAISNGSGSTKVKLTASRTFKVTADVGGTSAIFSISMEDSSRRAVTASFSSTDYIYGELVWIRGTVYKSGSAYAGRPLTVQRAKIGSSTWTTVGTAKSSSTGGYTFRINPLTTYRYRVMYTGATARSAPVTIEAHSGDRTLEQRASIMSTVTGAASGSIHNVSSGDLPSGVSSARYRVYAKGTLVEVTDSTKTRTWWVFDRIGASYKSTGSWEGKLGLPMRDAKCGLLEGGCVQRFTGGAIYQNSNKSGAFVAYATVPEAELIATAISQANYKEPSWRHNKFNTWVGASNAWCSVFQSWVGAASGNPTWVPKKTSYASFVSTLKASGKLHYSGTPPVGAIVLYDWQTGNPTHSGLVRGHSGDAIFTVEGNTSDGKGHPDRGVWLRSRKVVDVWAWYIPHELPN
jgi:hypothetical protein